MRDNSIAIIGLGYVGLPLAISFTKAGLTVHGIDKNRAKVSCINMGISPLKDVRSSELSKAIGSGKFSASSDFSILEECGAIIICVPTPLNKTKDPDVSYILDACREIKRHIVKGHLIVLESTTYPSFTREVILPMFEETGLKAGRDFFLAFSPERIDPGNRRYGVENTPKIVGGVTRKCTEKACRIYSKVIKEVYPVSSTDVAEMVKLLENTFRTVNIALVNEIAIMCHRLGVDTWEVIEAAKTKPFGFMPFYPGPGIGGHCLPVDPMYLSWKLKSLNYKARFIELADAINSEMAHFVVSMIVEALNSRKKCLNGSKILILGVSYKKDIEDIRESPAIEIIKTLRSNGAKVSYHDSLVPSLKTDSLDMKSVALLKGVEKSDCVVIITDHTSVDYRVVAEKARLIVDTRNAIREPARYGGKVFRL